MPLLEYLLSEDGEVDAPVAPDMTAVTFVIFILVAFRIQVFAIAGICLVQEIGIAYTYPVQSGIGLEHRAELLCHCGVDFLLTLVGIGQLEILFQRYCSREQSYVIKHIGVSLGDAEGMSAAHRQSADGTVFLILQHSVMTFHILDDKLS